MQKLGNEEKADFLSGEEKRLRVLHSAALLAPTSGILSQMQWEQEAAHLLGIDWKVRMYCPTETRGEGEIFEYASEVNVKHLSGRLRKLWAWISLRYYYHQWLLRNQEHFDVFLLRYYVHDPFQLWFIRRVKKPVYFVHHAIEIPELALPGGVISKIRVCLESIIGKMSISNVKGVIGVTSEIANYQTARAVNKKIKKLVFPNGILLNESLLIDERVEDIPEFLFVANFSPWHGLDILLAAIKDSRSKFVLHLVGKIPEELENQAIDPRIKKHGPLSQQQISMLSKRSWVGLASFALSRQALTEACPLKVREYLSLGLPVYGDYKDVFPAEAVFFKKINVPMDELISDMVDFAKTTRHFKKEQIRDMSSQYVDKKRLLANIYAELTN